MSRPGHAILLEETWRRLRLPTMVREYREAVRQAQEAHEGDDGVLLALATRWSSGRPIRCSAGCARPASRS